MRSWPLAFYLLLVLAGIGWWMDGGSARIVVLPTIAFMMFWEQVWRRMVVLDSPRAWPAIALLTATGIALNMVLTHNSMAFWLVGLAIVPMFFVVLPVSWAVIGAALLAGHAGLAGRAPSSVNLTSVELAAFLLSRGVLLVMIGLFLRSIVRQAARMQSLSETLAATRNDLAAAERVAGVLEERQRVARELHDTVTQGVSAVIMHLETAEQLLHTDIEAAGEQVGRARSVARESMEDMRRVIGALRPELLDRAELPEAITRAASRWAERTAILVRTSVVGPAVPLHAEVDITLLRAVQEALSNVRKHARAGNVVITLSYMGEHVALDIRDDGTGFAVDELTQMRGFGLKAMRERIEELGGDLTIESEPQMGTAISVLLPTWQTTETQGFSERP